MSPDRKRLLSAAAVVVGLILIVLAIVYWAEPAKSLPSFIPGHEAGSNHHHVKHGIAAFLVGLACLVFAWFNSGPQRTRTGTGTTQS
jgi:drug/metabolite transporter (DMT)-like permease